MELVRCLDLWGVPQLRELDEVGLGDAPCRGAAQLGIVAKLVGEFCGCAICPRRRAIQLSDHQQRRHANALELMHDRLDESHFRNPCLHLCNAFGPRPAIHARDHLHPTVVFRPPLAGIVEPLLVLLDAAKGRRLLDLEGLVEVDERDTRRLPVLQPDRVDQHELLHGIRKHQRIAHGRHATEGMTHGKAISLSG